MPERRSHGLTPAQKTYVAEVDAGVERGDVERLLGMIYELEWQLEGVKARLPQEKVTMQERAECRCG